MRHLGLPALVVLTIVLILGPLDLAADEAKKSATRSITDRSVEWPTWEQWKRVFSLRDYNTRVVVFGTTLLGCAGGMVGSFALLRKRALMGDALAHATLPGIVLTFILVTMAGGDGKSVLLLNLGATISGLVGIAVILAIRNHTRLKEDAALGIVLSVFFGAGISLLAISQQMSQGSSAGLESFIFGKTASMRVADAYMIAGAAAFSFAACLLLFKELKLLCFDEEFAGARGMPIVVFDAILMALVVVVVIVGLQAVGLLLMISLLVTPAASARFWTEQMWRMAFISAALGAAGGMIGAETSALFARLPSGPMIVLVYGMFFIFSMVFGTQRGVLIRWWRRHRLNRAIDRQHLLRAMYETLESEQRLERVPRTVVLRSSSVSLAELRSQRSWSLRRLVRAVRRAIRKNLVLRISNEVQLTPRGMQEAARLTRQHRLWELYLITYADIAPSRVDRDADAIEHVLEPELVAELEALLERQRVDVPQSPHELMPPPSGPSIPRGDP
jgi:manganese/zinc/iron transport system permease protein